MTDNNTLAPTDDLQKRCAEIIGWYRTAVLVGDTLRSHAESKWPGDIHNLQMAERATENEALCFIAKWGAPAPASSEPAAVPASGPAGFDHKTAANLLNGKTVTDEEVRQFVAHSRWAHDDRDGLRNTTADLRREIAQRDAEIALLKTSLLDAEAPTQAAQQGGA